MAGFNIRDFLEKTVIGKHEGGYQNNPKDTGNFVEGKNIGTNYGISAKTLKNHLGRTPTIEDMKNLKKETAIDIMEKTYYKDPKINKLPKHLQKNVLDMSINAGPSKAIKLLQKKAGVISDGKIGPNTLSKSGEVTNASYIEARQEHYKDITKNDPNKKQFLKGWLNRAASFAIPGAEGSEVNINEENMAKKEITKKPMKSRSDVESREILPEEDKLQEPPQTKEEVERKGMEDGFRDALLYFGPRLGALLVGGTDAMEITDKTLKGFEASQSAKKLSPFEQAKIEDSQADRDLKREQIGAQQQAAQMKALQKEQSEQEGKEIELEEIETKLSDYAQANEYLQKGNLTGFFDNYVLGTAADKVGGEKAEARSLLKQLYVDAGLANVAQTKGAISEREMELFLSPAPSMNDDESKWISWLARRSKALTKVHARLKKGIRLPTKQSASRDQIDRYQKFVADIDTGKKAPVGRQESRKDKLKRLREQKAALQR